MVTHVQVNERGAVCPGVCSSTFSCMCPCLCACACPYSFNSCILELHTEMHHVNGFDRNGGLGIRKLKR